MLIVEDVVPKLMRVIGEIKDFLPRFKLLQLHCDSVSVLLWCALCRHGRFIPARDAAAFKLDIPSVCIDPQTRSALSSC